MTTNNSMPIPAFRGHPDRPVDSPPKRSRARKRPKSGSLFDQTPAPPLPPPAAQNAAVPPSTAALESLARTDESKLGSGTSSKVTSVVEPPVQHDSVNASPGV
jgi:hypothetical protein